MFDPRPWCQNTCDALGIPRNLLRSGIKGWFCAQFSKQNGYWGRKKVVSFLCGLRYEHQSSRGEALSILLYVGSLMWYRRPRGPFCCDRLCYSVISSPRWLSMFLSVCLWCPAGGAKQVGGQHPGRGDARHAPGGAHAANLKLRSQGQPPPNYGKTLRWPTTLCTTRSTLTSGNMSRTSSTSWGSALTPCAWCNSPKRETKRRTGCRGLWHRRWGNKTRRWFWDLVPSGIGWGVGV